MLVRYVLNYLLLLLKPKPCYSFLILALFSHFYDLQYLLLLSSEFGPYARQAIARWFSGFTGMACRSNDT
jgi:hypothetical protein